MLRGMEKELSYTCEKKMLRGVVRELPNYCERKILRGVENNLPYWCVMMHLRQTALTESNNRIVFYAQEGVVQVVGTHHDLVDVEGDHTGKVGQWNDSLLSCC